MRWMLMAAGLMLGGCIGGGGSSGGGGGLPWVPCSEVPGEAPCCPQIDVEALCEDDETFDAQEVDGQLVTLSCNVSGAPSVAAGAVPGAAYVATVGSFRDGRTGWVGTMLCGADGRVIRFEALDGSPTGCTAACFAETEAECMPDEPVCPELNPFPLEQSLHAEAPDGGT